MKKTLLLLWMLTMELMSLVTLLVCSMYLVTKITLAYELNEVIHTLLGIGMGILCYQIHENLFKERRDKFTQEL